MISTWTSLLGTNTCDDCTVRLRKEDKGNMCILCIQRRRTCEALASNSDPMHAAICGDEDVDDFHSRMCNGKLAENHVCLVDTSSSQGVCVGRKRPHRPGQKVNLTRISVLDSDGNPMTDESGRPMQKVRIAGQVTAKNIKPIPEGMIVIGDTPEECIEEFRQRMKHAEYGDGTSKDGSLYKYSRAMALLFNDDSFFKTRDDFFKDDAKDAACEIFMKIAMKKVKDPTNHKKINHEMRCMKHGFDDFVTLVSRQSA